jgi:hypothetical protein
MNTHLTVGTASVFMVPVRAVRGAVSVLNPGKVMIVFVFPLPTWAAGVVRCPEESGTAWVCNWESCGGGVGGGGVGKFWAVSKDGRVGVGRVVATPLVTSRMRPSSKVVIISRSRRSEGGFFKFKLWFAESSGVTSGEADTDDRNTCPSCVSAGCIKRSTATSWAGSREGQVETTKGATMRRKM